MDGMAQQRSMKRDAILGRVTVITAIYNAAPTLRRCIESVLAQDHLDTEYILMDGGSTDGSIDILKSYGNRIFWRSERDRGIYDAWNKSLAMATGEWIAFLGADDFYLPGALNAYMQVANMSEAEYISSLVRYVKSSGKSEIIGESWSWPRFQSHMTTAHVGSMHRYSLFEKYGMYDISYRIVGDYELLLRPRDSLCAAFLPQITVEMQAGGTSDSFAALREARIAKTTTGGREVFLSHLDLVIAYAKLTGRRLLARSMSLGTR